MLVLAIAIVVLVDDDSSRVMSALAGCCASSPRKVARTCFGPGPPAALRLSKNGVSVWTCASGRSLLSSPGGPTWRSTSRRAGWSSAVAWTMIFAPAGASSTPSVSAMVARDGSVVVANCERSSRLAP